MRQQADSPPPETRTAWQCRKAPCLSTSAPSARYRQRSVGTEAISPGLDSLVINHAASIHLGQSLTGQMTMLFFLVDPGGQGLLDDPVLGALQALSHQIDLFGQLHRDVSRDRSVFCGSCHDRVTPDQWSVQSGCSAGVL